MTNPTSNFGWQMPTSTDLVTDLPADFETFGQAVDTSLADLKGGTSGQVLAKASNTDMDFTWVAQDDSNAIQNAIVDAKGDLIAASGADTPARLAVGANGETLVADSSTATGLRYTAGTVQSNPVLNSAMQIWQRGTSVSVASSTSTTYTADRWLAYTAANQATTVSRQSTNDSTNLPFIQYCSRVQRNAGQTGTSENFYSYNFETINSLPYAGKTVTVSFYARAGANYSAASGAFGMGVNTATGTDQVITSYNTGVLSPIAASFNLTTTWQRFTATGTLSSTLNEFGIFFRYTWAGTAGANDYFEVTGVQLDVGSVALPFRTYAGTIQGELAACQRYYWQSEAISQYFWSSQTISTINYYATGTLPVTMRVAPTVTLTSRDESSFPAAAGPVIRITTNSFLEYRAATATNPGGYYGSSVVASAEL